MEEARTFFNRVDNDLGKSFGKLDSGTRPLSSEDRLRILHDFSGPATSSIFTSIWLKPSGRATTLRTISARMGSNSKPTISRWAARWAASFSSGSLPAISWIA
jgi:hypothetical protein